jgi:hypothetical protein
VTCSPGVFRDGRASDLPRIRSEQAKSLKAQDFVVQEELARAFQLVAPADGNGETHSVQLRHTERKTAMHTLTVSDNERTLLIEVLGAYLAKLPHEIHQTDNHAYRAMLQEKQSTLQQLLTRWSTHRVIRRHGRFALVEGAAGFAWTMASEAGDTWYWHPQSREWTAHPVTSPTPEAAAEGFDPDAPHAESHSQCRGVGPHAPASPGEGAS